MDLISDNRLTRKCAAALLALVFLAACTRDTNKVDLVAPFDADRVLAEGRATWSPSGETRAFAGGTRLKEPEVRIPYRVDVHDLQCDKLLVRLGNFTLTNAAGLALGHDEKRVECVVAADGADALLSGEVWLPESSAKEIHGFVVEHSALPLDGKNLALYRDWLLKGRPGATADVDAEIAREAAAPACPPR